MLSSIMMKCLIIAVLLSISEAGILNTPPKCITIRNVKYEQEIIRRGVNTPYQLIIDYDTNTLFFSYTARTTETFKIAYLNLKTSEYGLVTGIHGGFAIAVDSKSNTVYMGGEDGLYIFDYNTKSATKLNVSFNANIWQMFHKDRLYFTTFPNEKAYYYKNDHVAEIPELTTNTMEIAVKNDGSFIYSNSSGLFTYNKNTRKTIYIGEYVVNGISSDIDGHIYFSTPTEIFYIDDKTNEVEKLVTLESVYGVTIEGNQNIIYAFENGIIRLKPTKNKCVDDQQYKKH